MKYCYFGLGFAKNKDIMEKLTTTIALTDKK